MESEAAAIIMRASIGIFSRFRNALIPRAMIARSLSFWVFPRRWFKEACVGRTKSFFRITDLRPQSD
jgi:hypothetical protein